MPSPPSAFGLGLTLSSDLLKIFSSLPTDMMNTCVKFHWNLPPPLNAAARLVFSTRKHEPVSPLLRDLHWLPVSQRIEFKLAVLTYRCLHAMAPPYLADELHRVADIDSQRRLRSASTSTLIPPTRHSIIGDHAFLVAAWRVWNSLPSSVTSSTSLSAFRRRLKTELFSRCFGLDSAWNFYSMFCILFYCEVFLQS